MCTEDLDPSRSQVGLSCTSHVKGRVPARESAWPRSFKKRVAEAGIGSRPLGQPRIGAASPGRRGRGTSRCCSAGLLPPQTEGGWRRSRPIRNCPMLLKSKKENDERNVALKHFHLEREGCAKGKKLRQPATIV